MDAKTVTMLDDVIVASCRAVFESVGASLDRVETVSGDADDVGASIGFTGTSLRGALVLISSKRLIEKVLPIEVGRTSDDAKIADWMGELTNQMLGRIKNRLLSYGVILEMSTPTVLFGLSLSRRGTGSNVRRDFYFRHGSETLTVSFDALATSDFVLNETEAAVGPSVAEGDIALF